MLEVSHVSVNYDHVVALEDISCTINDGAIVSIIGSNGAGKTTLLNTISGLVKKKAGTITWHGKSLPQKPHKVVRTGIVQVPEGRHVFANLTVTENLIMGGSRLSHSKSHKNIEEMYKHFPILDERRAQKAGLLSGGEQQMLAIGLALMSNPRLLLLDEPSLGLAPMLVSEIFVKFKEINQRVVTILLVEQNARQALALAHRAYVMQTGRIIKEGTGKELLRDPQVQEAYLGVKKK